VDGILSAGPRLCAEAVARSGVPVLLFVGRKDPRYPLVLSFAEQSGAKVIVLAEYDCATTAPAAGSAEILSRILAFFEAPRGSVGLAYWALTPWLGILPFFTEPIVEPGFWGDYLKRLIGSWGSMVTIAGTLAVEPQQVVVGQAEAADGRF
jgi:hypothetical protein